MDAQTTVMNGLSKSIVCLDSARSGNANSAIGVALAVQALALHLLDDALAFDNLTEDDVLAVEVGSRDELYQLVSCTFGYRCRQETEQRD